MFGITYRYALATASHQRACIGIADGRRSFRGHLAANMKNWTIRVTWILEPMHLFGGAIGCAENHSLIMIGCTHGRRDSLSIGLRLINLVAPRSNRAAK